MTIYTPYTYHIAWTGLDKHYYGVRYAKGCHPDDLWRDYFTSSAVVAEYRQTHGEPDVVEIRKTFTCSEKAQAWEVKVLQRLDVLHSDKWLNQSINGVWIVTEEVRRKISEANTGRPGPNRGKTFSEETRRKQSLRRKGKPVSEAHRQTMLGRTPWNKGKKLPPLSDETRSKMSEVRKGKPKSEEHRRKISEGHKKRHMKKGAEAPSTATGSP